MKRRARRRKFISWISPKLKVKRTRKYNNGVFAKNIIKKGELLSIFGGHILSAKEWNSLPKHIWQEGVQVAENFILTATNESEVENASYFNHSCEPNAGYKGQIILAAIRNIKKYEEITFDYAMEISKAKGIKPFTMECLCGSKNCRKIIKETDWKLPELQKKYDGYFQWYLQEKINKLKK